MLHSHAEIRRRIDALGPWFHNMELAGVETAPNHFLGNYPLIKWRKFAEAIPADLTGKTVLDIGCNAGFYSIEMKRRLSVYDVGALRETFDIVLFMGVLYHLRHPLLALDLIREHVAGDLMIFQSMQRGSTDLPEMEENYHFWTHDLFDRPEFPKLHFIEHRYADDPTNWWIPNRACTEAMLRSAGFEIVLHPEQEVYFCRAAGDPASGGPVYPSKGQRHD
ncbi:methyltransferase domain-containing protein [Mesorhizobium sp. L2C084A000]|uniref:methyltransferase domain-containing protein n=1 Tax=Mesorhizobium sp. L2C084A000 TaxID=1287116 RepID=UPI0003D069DF|nr:methyltransferase domain-containing protein [Mesorhizobium sp. L2C084A000]ESZ28627.1 SAM-dependent methyltransferase [Mesorhizobium sp. L2C084A000]